MLTAGSLAEPAGAAGPLRVGEGRPLVAGGARVSRTAALGCPAEAEAAASGLALAGVGDALPGVLAGERLGAEDLDGPPELDYPDPLVAVA
jgi:hypothetical protein